MILWVSAFFWIYSSFNGNILGFPVLYISLFFLLLFVNNFRFSIQSSLGNAFSIGLVPLVLFYSLSPFFSSYIFSTIKYSVGFAISILCVFLFNNILSCSFKFSMFAQYLKKFIFFSLFASFISFFVQDYPSINSNFLFLHSDPNQIVFVSIFLTLIFYLSKEYFALSLVFFFGILHKFFLFRKVFKQCIWL